MWVCRWYTPPVVGENVENAKDEDEECSGPLGFEADSDHDAGDEAYYGDKDTGDIPCSLDDEAEEKEDKEHTSSKQEAVKRRQTKPPVSEIHVLFLAVCFANSGDACK